LIKVTLLRGMARSAVSWEAAFGGAILNTGSVSAVDCSFLMNQAAGRSGGLTTDGVGGALYNEGQFTATGCLFDRNASYGGNGLVVAGGSYIVPLAGGQMALNLIGLPGVPYVFDATTNWTDWLPLSTNITASNGRTYFIDLDAPRHPRRFYRALNRSNSEP
jgi:hypothetical protein